MDIEIGAQKLIRGKVCYIGSCVVLTPNSYTFTTSDSKQPKIPVIRSKYVHFFLSPICKTSQNQIFSPKAKHALLTWMQKMIIFFTQKPFCWHRTKKTMEISIIRYIACSINQELLNPVDPLLILLASCILMQ